jgi:hypothetical protein
MGENLGGIDPPSALTIEFKSARNSVSLFRVKPKNAIAEIRPHTGELVCVANFKLAPHLKIIDLKNSRRELHPVHLAVGVTVRFLAFV